MTDRPITGSVAVYATLLQPIERHLVLISPSVCPVTNNPDAQQQEEEFGETPSRTLSGLKHTVVHYKLHIDNSTHNVDIIKL